VKADVTNDTHYMREALALARRGWGKTHPNPMVGALIVEDHVVVARGWHERDGGPHAEKAAIAALGRKPAKGATLYVTLEPCSTPGRTGACSDAIIAAGIANVVIGTLDPNPLHAGKALPLLESRGIHVRHGILDKECRELNRIFNHWITTGRPLVAAKLALTLDGKMATSSGHARWITGAEARADVMQWRRLFPAIAVAAGTVLADDPQLTARLPDGSVWCPQRCVIDRTLRTAAKAELPKVYSDDFAMRTLVFCSQQADPIRLQRLRDVGVTVVPLTADSDADFLHALIDVLVKRKLTGIYFEPGPKLFQGLMAAGVVDYLWFYLAPKIIGDPHAPGLILPSPAVSMDQAFALIEPQWLQIADDVRVGGRVNPKKVVRS
jgi:diaminohydroxyphosphoribosylaminopyrimidine deaminase/5-amino-6-(5-phosphoribosylamino)uracil reductase